MSRAMTVAVAMPSPTNATSSQMSPSLNIARVVVEGDLQQGRGLGVLRPGQGGRGAAELQGEIGQHDNENKDLTEEDAMLVYTKSMELQNLYNSINNTIDSISFYQKSLKSDTVAFAKNKNAQVFYNELQKVKGEFMATKKTSMFADEEKLREKVSKLYGNFCGMESKPNSTQLESISDLNKEYATQKDALKKTLVKNLPKNPELNKPKEFK